MDVNVSNVLVKMRGMGMVKVQEKKRTQQIISVLKKLTMSELCQSA